MFIWTRYIAIGLPPTRRTPPRPPDPAGPPGHIMITEHPRTYMTGMFRDHEAGSPFEGVGGTGGPEVPDIDALGPPDADPARQRLMHVAEEGIPRLATPDLLK
jgi:hypothetical protein